MKFMTFFVLFSVFQGFFSQCAQAGNLTAQGIYVADMSGLPRTAFSNSERIVLRQSVYNPVSSKNKVNFKFTIYDPRNTSVFIHSGNAAPGSIGQAQSQVAGTPISQFYTTPGYYKLAAEAELDGEILRQEISFMASSPNIILTYPPNGARNLADKPLVFRWTASGATRYKVTVGNDSSFYNSVFSQESSGESYLNYPEIVSDPRQNLVSGQVYYWKVEGLDSAGNKVAESGVPFSFSVQPQAASQSRNIAVVFLDVDSQTIDFSRPVPFRTLIKNQGTTSESNISARFSLGGMPASGSPVLIPALGPGEQKDLSFTAFLPQDQQEGLAVVCIDVFDDNVSDNCKSRLVSRKASITGGAAGAGRTLSPQELWEILKKRLGADAADALAGYDLSSLTCDGCQGSELNDLIISLLSGDSQIAWSNLPQLKEVPGQTGGGIPGISQAFQSAAEPETGAGSFLLSLDVPDSPPVAVKKKGEMLDEWYGMTMAFPSKNVRTMIINNQKEWKKLWAIIAKDEAPGIDFKKFMVLGLVAGRNENAVEIKILEVQPLASKVMARYYVIEAPQTHELKGQAYRLKLVELNDKEVEFKKLNPEE